MKEKSHLGRVARRTVEDEVYARLRRAILAGEFGDGERLVHDDLAERFGTSRIPVRDALKRLVVDGLVDAEGGRRGHRVAVFGRDDIDELYTLRAIIEGRAASIAAVHISDDDLDALVVDHEAMATMADTGDREAYIEINQRFHSRIYSAAGQPRTARIIDGLWRGLPPLTPIAAFVSLATAIAEHRMIIDALAAHDSQAAEDAVSAHVARAHGELLAHIEDTGRLL